ARTRAYHRGGPRNARRRTRTPIAASDRQSRPRPGDTTASRRVSRRGGAGAGAALDLVGACVAPHAEPLAAARTVLPKLVVRPGRIVTHVDELEPGVGRCIGCGALHRRVAAVRELDLCARAAPRTGDHQHG